jgi:hypothetical protein
MKDERGRAFIFFSGGKLRILGILGKFRNYAIPPAFLMELE